MLVKTDDYENNDGTPVWIPLDKVASGTAAVYLDYKAANERGESGQEYQDAFLEKLYQRNSGWLKGIQFDMLPWDQQAQQEMLRNIRETQGSDFKILVQCYGQMMDLYQPEHLKAVLEPLEGVVDYVLFDSSHGTGKKLDVEALEPYVEEASQLDWLAVGVAGGLNAENVAEELAVLLRKYPDLSFDAEGNLHKTRDGSLDLQEVLEYLSIAQLITD
jgi:hypothetical protein